MVSTYFMNCIMGNVFKTKTNPALPSKVYLALSKTAPAIDGTGSSEPSTAAGYKRVELTNLSAPNNGVVTNNAEVTFPKSTSDWGTITHFVVYDAESNGNLLLAEQVTKPRVIQEDTIVAIEQGGLRFTLTNV